MGAVSFLQSLLRVLFSWAGVAILVLTAATIFPKAAREYVISIRDFLWGFSWSISAQASLAILASLTAIILVIIKLISTDRAVSSRQLRRSRDKKALELLYSMSDGIWQLSTAMFDYIDIAVGQFERERHLAHIWFKGHSEEGMTTSKKRVLMSTSHDDHERCTPACAKDLYSLNKSTESPLDTNFHEAIQQLGEVSKVGELKKYERELARILNRKAWEGFIELTWRSGDSWKTVLHLPAKDEWRERRIDWQHRNVVIHSQKVSISPSIEDPDDSWFENDLHRQIWDIAKKARELEQLAEFGWNLNRPKHGDFLQRLSDK